MQSEVQAFNATGGNSMSKQYYKGRLQGSVLAELHGLVETAEAIRDPKSCFKRIFSIAIQETGSIDKVIAMLQEAKNPFWVYHFAHCIPNLTEDQVTELIQILVSSENSEGLKYHFVYCVPYLTENQRAMLSSKVA